MDNADGHDDIPLRWNAPRQPAEFGQHPIAHVLVALSASRIVANRHGESLHQIGAADDAHQNPCVEDRHATNALRFEQVSDLAQRCHRSDRDNIGRHDVSCDTSMRFHIIDGLPAIDVEHIQPVAVPFFGAEVSPPVKIPARYDADQTPGLIDDRQTADVVLGHELGESLNRGIRMRGHNLCGHHIPRSHHSPPASPAEDSYARTKSSDHSIIANSKENKFRRAPA
jgi:hypothetical protein